MPARCGMRRPCFVGLSWVHVQECTEMECAAATSGPDLGLGHSLAQARLAQLAERKALNLVVVGSSPTVGVGSTLSSCDGDSFVGGGRGLGWSPCRHALFVGHMPHYVSSEM